MTDLYERFHAQIYRFCLRELRSPEEAEDATQTTFLNALRGLHRGVRPELESAWLYAIAQNVCRTRRRASWRRGRVERPDDLDTLEQVVAAPGPIAREELMGLSAALESMPESQRQAILLREWKGLSYDEIGNEMGLSHSAVETLIFRARRRLARGLQQLEPKRLRQLADGGGLLGVLKALLTGGAAGKALVTGAAAVLIGGSVVAGEQIATSHSHPRAPAVRTQVAAPGDAQAAGVVQSPSGLDVSSVVSGAISAVVGGSRSATGAARVTARRAAAAAPATPPAAGVVDTGSPAAPTAGAGPNAISGAPPADRGIPANPAAGPKHATGPAGKQATRKAPGADKQPGKTPNGHAATKSAKSAKTLPAKDPKQTPPGQSKKDAAQSSSTGTDQSAQGSSQGNGIANGQGQANGQGNVNTNGQANANGQNGGSNGQSTEKAQPGSSASGGTGPASGSSQGNGQSKS